MVALKAGEVDRAIAAPNPRWRLWLVYGPDAGLVSERVEALVSRALGPGGDDPFRLCRLDGDEVASDPMRLPDEAHTVGLFGGERVVRVGRTSRNLAPAVELLLAKPPENALIVIEAGELAARHVLRVLCEKSDAAVTAPCYADEGRNLATMVDQALVAEGLTIDRDARELLLASLGSDRLVSRRELEKLFAYAGDAKRIEIADIEACVGDSALREADALADAVFAGDFPGLDAGWMRLRQEGVDPGVLAGVVLRQALFLLGLQGKLDAGQSRQIVIDGLRLPPRRKAAIQGAIGRWNSASLADATVQLGRAVAEARRNPALATEHVQRTLIGLARGGARQSPGRQASRA